MSQICGKLGLLSVKDYLQIYPTLCLLLCILLPPIPLRCTLTLQTPWIRNKHETEHSLFPGEMKGYWGLKGAVHAAKMTCHNTGWIKGHGGRETQEAYKQALFSPSVSVCHKVTSTDFIYLKFHFILEKLHSCFTLTKT